MNPRTVRRSALRAQPSVLRCTRRGSFAGGSQSHLDLSELEQRAGLLLPQVARSMVAKLARTLWAEALAA